jgi:hypothetical protein
MQTNQSRDITQNKSGKGERVRSEYFIHPVVYYCIFVGAWLFWSGWADGWSLGGAVRAWEKWDSVWYQQIARQGYSVPESMAFPPGYSSLVWLSGFIFQRPFPVMATAINILAGFLFYYWASVVCREKFKASPQVLFWLLLSNPLGYFIFPSYSDFVFSALLWGMVLLHFDPRPTRGKKILSVVVILTLPLFRLTGFSLVSLVLIKQYRFLLVLFPLVGWFWLNYYTTGNALHFLVAQEAFGMPSGYFLDGLQRGVGTIWSADLRHPEFNIEKFAMDALTLGLFLSLLGVTVWLALRGEYFLAILCLSVLLFSHNQAFWRSGARYDLPLLPLLYVAVMRAGDFLMGTRKWVKTSALVLLVLCQFVIQFWLGGRFVSGNWSY